MNQALIALITFVGLAAASLGSAYIYRQLPEHHRQDDTNNVVRLVASIFALMTSLVLGLMINSSKNSYETLDRAVHSLATEIILLDRSLREYGPQANPAREPLATYLSRLVKTGGSEEEALTVADPVSEETLVEAGARIRQLEPADDRQAVILSEARQYYQKVIEMRWDLVEQGGGGLPLPLVVILITWLMMIFASFGYRAPRNAVVAVSFVTASFLMACSLYLIIDMSAPFDGPMRISRAPLERALAEVRR